MVAGFWPAAERKVVKSLPFQTKRPSRRNNFFFFNFFKLEFPEIPLWADSEFVPLGQEFMGHLKLSRHQRLSSKKEIESLFSKGKSWNLSPIRIIYLVSSKAEAKNQVLFSVPSRVFKKAVDRNLLKRRMREAYRINQSKLEVPLKLILAYIYIAKRAMPYSEIEKKVIESFQKLKNEFEV